MTQLLSAIQEALEGDSRSPWTFLGDVETCAERVGQAVMGVISDAFLEAGRQTCTTEAEPSRGPRPLTSDDVSVAAGLLVLAVLVGAAAATIHCIRHLRRGSRT